MNIDKLFEVAFYTLPALITGGVAYYLFDSYFKDQQNTRRWLLQKENQRQSLPLRLQAYERLALLLERINPSKLMLRVAPFGDDKNDYERLLIQHIEQEFEHNLTQQIYVSEECWTIITTAKNTTIQNIMKTNKSDKVTNAQELRETLFNNLIESQSATTIALTFLKNEVKDIL